MKQNKGRDKTILTSEFSFRCEWKRVGSRKDE